MLSSERLNIELNNAIKWLKDYVESFGGKGVVIRK